MVTSRKIIEYDIYKKNEGIAFAMWVLFGWVGGHRLYLGLPNLMAIIQLVIIGFVWYSVDSFRYGSGLTACAVGGLILAMLLFLDVIRIPEWTRQYNIRVLRMLENNEIETSPSPSDIDREPEKPEPARTAVLLVVSVLIVSATLLVMRHF